MFKYIFIFFTNFILAQNDNFNLMNSEKYWRNKLTDDEYKILREKGTEYPFSGKYNIHFEDGTYKCKGCDEDLFESTSKFKSDCGWPSFDNSIEGKITKLKDYSFGMIRTEIICTNCKSHLGHIFDDGPTKSGLRYCVNSLSLKFKDK